MSGADVMTKKPRNDSPVHEAPLSSFDRHRREHAGEDRRRLLGVAGLALAGAWLGSRQSVQRIIAAPFHAGDGGELRALDRAGGWLNSAPLTEAELRGKVVLVEFWTLTCINWLRQLPYVRAWDARYRDRGLVVIGVHAPEFSFEKDVEGVRRAVKDRGMTFPIAIDSSHDIWRGFRNQYWPALYFIDAKGQVRHRQFGEGHYDESEATIQQLLREAGSDPGGGVASPTATGSEVAADWENLRSPENYLGYGQTQHFSSPGGAEPDERHLYAVPSRLRLNEWALAGDWIVEREAAVLQAANGRIACRFHARDVHLVLRPAMRGTPVRFRVRLEGAPVGAAHGFDVDEQGHGTITEGRLYQLVRQSGPIADRTIEIEFLDPGVQAYSFTFG
jgi:hypothetical protein